MDLQGDAAGRLTPQWNFSRDDLELGKLHVFSGAPFSGKSSILADIIGAIIHGGTWAGMEVKKVPILLADHENGDRIIVKRVDRALASYGGDGDVEELLHVVDTEHREEPFSTTFATDLLSEFYHCDENGTKVPDDAPRGILIIDTMRSAFAGDPLYEENSNDAMSALLKPWRTWSHKSGWAVVVLHHAGKGGGYSGATAIMSNADIAWTWESSKEQLTGKFSMAGSTDDHQLPLKFNFDLPTQRNVFSGVATAQTEKKEKNEEVDCIQKIKPVLDVLSDDASKAIGLADIVKASGQKKGTVEKWIIKGVTHEYMAKVGTKYFLTPKGVVISSIT